jgi:SAM-dependent methyltransferase
VFRRLNAIQYNIKRMTVVYADFGVGELVRRLLRRAGIHDRSLSAWRKQKQRSDAEFDARYGTDTGGVQSLADVADIVGDNAKHGLAHIASDPDQFSGMLGKLALHVPDYTFVDLGCGKGRALLLAGEVPFKSVIGVEFVPAFADVARKNLAIAAAKGMRSDIEVVTGDATQFDFPSGPLLVYLFNPFDSSIIRRVAQNVMKSWRAERRPVFVVYANPIHKDEFLALGWSISISGPGWTAFTVIS